MQIVEAQTVPNADCGGAVPASAKSAGADQANAESAGAVPASGGGWQSLCLQTQRLLLRPLTQDADLPGLAALCSDPQVMRYFAAHLDYEGARALLLRNRGYFEQNGYGLFGVYLREDAVAAVGAAVNTTAGDCRDVIKAGALAGFVGMMKVGDDMPFAPAVEIAWRFFAPCWGQGYACEAARAVLAFAFDTLGLAEVVAFTTLANEPSQRLMQRLGMQRNPAEDFDHPRLPAGHPLLRHCLYRIDAKALPQLQ